MPAETKQDMSIDAILEGLRVASRRFPRAELLAAVAQQEAITPRLIEVIEDVGRDPAPYLDGEADLRPLAALFLLAQFRETRACRPVADFFVLEPDTFDRLAGDTATDRGSMILAAVCGDDPTVIQAIVENPGAHVYARTSALRALVALVLHGRWPRAEAVAYLRSLLTERLVREQSYLWTDVVVAAASLHPGELLAEIGQAYDDGLVDAGFCGDLEHIESEATRAVADVLREGLESPANDWITNVIDEMQWWAFFEPSPRPGGSRALPPYDGAWTGEPQSRRPRAKADKAKAKAKRKQAKASKRRNR